MDSQIDSELDANNLRALSFLDIAVPYEAYMIDLRTYYNNKISEVLLKENMSVEEVTFILKDNRNLNQLRSMLNKMPFLKNIDYMSNSVT